MSSLSHEKYMEAIGRTEFGLVRAPDVFDDTDPHTPAEGMKWATIHALTNMEITSIEWDGVAVAGYVGKILLAGVRIYGKWTSIEAASGEYECSYLAPELS